VNAFACGQLNTWRARERKRERKRERERERALGGGVDETAAGRANEKREGSKIERERALGAVIKPQAEFPTARPTRHASPRPSTPFRAARPPFIINAIRSYYAPLPYAPTPFQSPSLRSPIATTLLHRRLARIRARNSSPSRAWRGEISESRPSREREGVEG